MQRWNLAFRMLGDGDNWHVVARDVQSVSLVLALMTSVREDLCPYSDLVAVRKRDAVYDVVDMVAGTTNGRTRENVKLCDMSTDALEVYVLLNKETVQ